MKRNGFTLLELLLVMGCVILFMTFFISGIYMVKERSKDIYCINNLRNINVLMQIYLAASSEVLPIATAKPSLDLVPRPTLADVLKPFGANKMIFRCLADQDNIFFISENSSYEYNETLCGRKIGYSKLFKIIGLKPWEIPVVYDFEPFHKGFSVTHKNYLWGDWHVGQL